MAKKILNICHNCGKSYQSTQYGKRQRFQKYCGVGCQSDAKTTSPIARFYKSIQLTDYECWEWIGSKTNLNYGTISIGSKNMLAHRFSFGLAFSIDHKTLSNHCVLHICDNPPCVNPAHLFLGSQTENMQDKIAKGRQMQGNDCSWAKTNENQVRYIRELYKKGGITHKEIGELVGLTRKNVGNIINRKIWKHVI